MRRVIVLVGALSVAGCGEPRPSGGEDASTSAADAAAVDGPDGSALADAAVAADATAAQDAADPSLDAAEPPDAQAAGVDASLQDDAGAPDGGATPACAPGVAGCTCVAAPADPALACRHSFGGQYSNHACSGSYQCCEGSWKPGQGSCGACTCVEQGGIEGCVGTGEAVQVCFESFAGTFEPLPAAVRQAMDGVSWRAGCPVPLDQLSLLSMSHWGFDGAVHQGVMVVAASSAADVLLAFQRIYETRFPIERMKLVDDYGADDDASMADNNTSAFNCRPITGGSSWSQHSYGTAIDVNPVQNPYVHGTLVLPPAGSPYLDRDDERPGMIVDPGPAVGAFRAIGWYWGGAWATPKDYQHFSNNDG